MLHIDRIYFNQNKLIKRIFRYENSMNDKKILIKIIIIMRRILRRKVLFRNKNKLILKIINISNKLGQKKFEEIR
jgi:hypothetical protein